MAKLAGAATLVLLGGVSAAPCTEDFPSWGQKMIHDPGCEGVGCRANGIDDDCAWCVTNITKCSEQAWGAQVCQETMEARHKEGITDCDHPVKCSADYPEWGERQITVPGCVGAGCRANGVHDDCAWCVYDVEKCSSAFDAATCLQVSDARKAQGYDNCTPMIEKPATPTCDADFPSWGERQILVPGCQGAGCRANGIDDDCAWCVYDQNKCSSQGWGPKACEAVTQARRAQGVLSCHSPSPSAACEEDQPSWGERKIYVPNCIGVGCRANGKDQDCAWCVYDVAKCSAAFDSKTCLQLLDARKAQGITDCNITAFQI